jgi:hypothetical protein
VNATRYLGHFLAVTFRAPNLRRFVLGDGIGALEGLAALFHNDTGRSARVSSTGHSLSNSSDEVTLPQFNTAMPQNVVGGRAMEIKVGHHEVH